MPLNASYTATQTSGLPSYIKFTDTSTGSDAAVVGRRIFLVDYKNDAVVPSGTTTSYIVWPLADTVFSVDVLLKDMAINIVIQWIDEDGTVLYQTTSRLQGFTLFNESFYYALTQAQASLNQPPPMIIQDSSYYANKGILRTEIDSGNSAITIGADILTAQSCYDMASRMTENEQKYF